MTITPNRQSVRAIQRALADITGALREEPLAEQTHTGHSPAQEVWRHDPDAANSPAFTEGLVIDDESDLKISDEPTAIFEVPPHTTDSDIKNALGDDELDRLERLQQIRGIDALGWYVSFHQSRYQYGIHIPAEGVAYLVLDLIRRGQLDVPLPRMFELAFQAILRHELFHFETDCMIANWELVDGYEIYWSSREKYRSSKGCIEREEALANAYMLRGFKHPSARRKAAGVHGALKRFCEAQPAGYKDGPRYSRSRHDFLTGCRDLSTEYREASGTDWVVSGAFDSLLLYNDPTRIDWTRCPIVLVDSHGLFHSLGIVPSYFQRITHVTETPAFTRKLDKLDKRIVRLWQKRKNLLAQTTAQQSHDLKKWPKSGDNWYSVRVDNKYRAHLRHDPAASMWFAESIGTHTQMHHD